MAIEYLADATTLRPQDPTLWVDLAAAQIARAERDDRPFDLVLAMGNAQRALDLAPEYRFAQFSYALTLDLLGLWDAAIRSWSAFLAADSGSSWAEEARARRRQLIEARTRAAQRHQRGRVDDPWLTASAAARLAAESPQAARLWVQSSFLPAWADLEASTIASLAPARAVGEKLFDRSGDRWVLDVVESIERCLAPLSVSCASDLRVGLIALGKGLEASDHWRSSDALAALGCAVEHLRRTDSPLAVLSRLVLGLAYYRGDQIPDAIRLWDTVGDELEGTEYLALRGRYAWLRGLAYLVAGKKGSAHGLSLYEHARDLFEAAGEDGHAAAVSSLISQAQMYHGSDRASWRAFFRAIASANRSGSNFWHYFTSAVLGDVAWTQQENELALLLKRSAAESLGPHDAVVRRVDARTWFAWALARAGETDAALDQLLEIDATIGQIPDRNARERARADHDLVSGSARKMRNPRIAIARLSRALDYYRSRSLPAYRALCLLERGSALRVNGDHRSALEDLEQAVEIRERLAMQDASWRPDAGLRDRLDDTYDSVLDVLLDDALDAAHALRLLERRQRYRWFRSAETSQEDLLPIGNLRRLTERLGAHQRVVIIEQKGDDVVSWMLRGDVFDHYERRPTVGLRDAIRTFARCLEGGDLPCGDFGQQVGAAVLAPWLHDVPAGTEILIVTDGLLATVPFAALPNPLNGRLLVEDHAVGVVPSLQHLWVALKRQDWRADLESALVVGDPVLAEAVTYAFDLDRLKAANEEAREVAVFYEQHTLLLDSDATRRRVVELLTQVDVAHFATHALLDARRPERSAIVLAPSQAGWRSGGSPVQVDDVFGDPFGAGTEDGLLEAATIAGLDLRGLRVAVLSGCRSSTVANSEVAGLYGMARAFLDAGAGAVVGTHWLIDDAITRSLMVAFHQARGAGHTNLQALRQAQLHMLRNPDSRLRTPAVWAAFQIVGL